MSDFTDATSPTAEQEVWRDIPSLTGRYQASSLGRIRSLPRMGVKKRRMYGGKVLSLSPNPNGYLKFNACLNGAVEMTFAVHRAVCAAFHGEAEKGKYIAAHNDGDKLNNRPENLRWTNHVGNADDAVSHGTVTHGSKNRHAKLTAEQVAEIRLIPNTKRDEACKKYGISHSHFYLLKRGHCWTPEGRALRRRQYGAKA